MAAVAIDASAEGKMEPREIALMDSEVKYAVNPRAIRSAAAVRQGNRRAVLMSIAASR